MAMSPWRVLGSREILVTQANWEPNRIDRASPVLDVSARNDWSLVRVWWRPARQFGSGRYMADGFILPQPAASLPWSRARTARSNAAW